MGMPAEEAARITRNTSIFRTEARFSRRFERFRSAGSGYSLATIIGLTYSGRIVAAQHSVSRLELVSNQSEQVLAILIR